MFQIDGDVPETMREKLYVEVDTVGELYEDGAQFSASSAQANLWTALPGSLLIPPVSLSCLSPPPHSTREDDRGKS